MERTLTLNVTPSSLSRVPSIHMRLGNPLEQYVLHPERLGELSSPSKTA